MTCRISMLAGVLNLAELEIRFVCFLPRQLEEFRMPTHILRLVSLKIPAGAGFLHDAGALHALGKTTNEIRCAFLLIFFNLYIYHHSGMSIAHHQSFSQVYAADMPFLCQLPLNVGGMSGENPFALR